MDRFKACVKKIYCVNRFILKKKILYPKVKKVEVNEDLSKPFKDFVQIACSVQMKIVGCYVFTPNFRWTFMTYVTWIDIIIYLIVNSIDIWIFWGDLKSLCYCLVTYAFGFAGFGRIYLAVTSYKTCHKFLEKTCGFEKTFDRSIDFEEIELYKNYGKWCKRVGIFSTFWFVIVGSASMSYPGLIYMASGMKVLPFGFVIPGISYIENPGYAINYVYQILQVLLTMNGFMVFLHVFFLFVMNVSFQADLIVIKLRKLNQQIIMEGSYDEEIIKIVKNYQDFLTYLKEVEQKFSFQNFMDFACFTFQNVVTLFVLVHQVWIIGYMLVITDFVLLLIPSAFGALIEAKNDHLADEIYAVSWHLLKTKERESMRFLLEIAQNARMLSCGGFLPLNMVLFQKTYNRIYSYLMFLKDTTA